MVIASFLFDWALNFQPLFAVIIISVIVSVLITLAYKYFTNQVEMKETKKKMDELRDKTKEKGKSMEEIKNIQSELMKLNFDYMKHTFKPKILLITMVPIYFIFAWFNSTLAYEPLLPDQSFTITMDAKITGSAILDSETLTIISDSNQQTKPIGKNGNINQAAWTVKGPEGKHIFEIDFLGRNYTKEILITNQQKYISPISDIKDDKVIQINSGNNKLNVLNLFGWKLGWLGTYILISLIIGMAVRKLLKIA